MRIRDCSSDVCSSDLVEKQTHRRFLKTHLPVDALVFSPKARYIYIGRDRRDVAWSMYNHHANANHLWYEALNDTPGPVGPPIEKTGSTSCREARVQFVEISCVGVTLQTKKTNK